MKRRIFDLRRHSTKKDVEISPYQIRIQDPGPVRSNLESQRRKIIDVHFKYNYKGWGVNKPSFIKLLCHRLRL